MNRKEFTRPFCQHINSELVSCTVCMTIFAIACLSMIAYRSGYFTGDIDTSKRRSSMGEGGPSEVMENGSSYRMRSPSLSSLREGKSTDSGLPRATSDEQQPPPPAVSSLASANATLNLHPLVNEALPGTSNSKEDQGDEFVQPASVPRTNAAVPPPPTMSSRPPQVDSRIMTTNAVSSCPPLRIRYNTFWAIGDSHSTEQQAYPFKKRKAEPSYARLVGKAIGVNLSSLTVMPGRTARDMADAMRYFVPSIENNETSFSPRYDFCLVLAGSNDMFRNFSVENIVQSLSEIHEICLKVATTSIVQLVPPRRCGADLAEEFLFRQKLNAAIDTYSLKKFGCHALNISDTTVPSLSVQRTSLDAASAAAAVQQSSARSSTSNEPNDASSLRPTISENSSSRFKFNSTDMFWTDCVHLSSAGRRSMPVVWPRN